MKDYLFPPKIVGSPGPDYAKKQRNFQGIPGIEISSTGRFWAVWYGGGDGEDRYNHILCSTSADGKTWSSPVLIIDPDGPGPVRAFDPCLWYDPLGCLWLFWAQGYEGHTDKKSGVWAMITEDSHVKKPSWSEPFRICDGIMMNKPTVLSSGEWLLPVAQWRQPDSAKIYCSLDKGGRWAFIGGADVPEKHRNCDEHMIVELQDGKLWMLVRTTYGIGYSLSLDRGRTWSRVFPSPIPHPPSRFFIRRLCSGNLLLVKHGPMDYKTDRSRLTAFLSQDEGGTWTDGMLLDERPGVSYPDGTQGRDGTIHIIYDYDRRGEKEILLSSFTEEDVLEGTPVSGDSSFRVLVNKA